MAKKHFQFTTTSKQPPSIELDEAGLYVRFQPGVKAAKTIIRSTWPHVAVDLAIDGSLVGIECVPVPNQFSIGQLAKQAGVTLPARMSAADMQIHRRSSVPEVITA